MKIAQFSDSFLPVVDGVGRVVFSYASTLGQKGHECYVIAPMTDTGFRGFFPFEIVDYHGMPLPGMPQYRAGTPLLDQHYNARIETIKPDIIHLHSPFIAGQEGMRLARRLDIPLVATFHSKYYDDFLKVSGSEAIADFGVKYVVAFYDRCDEVWAVSNSSAETLTSYGFTGEIRVMPNGTDVPPADPESRDAAMRKFSPDGKPLLLFVGQMNWKKNILRILEASAMLKKDGVAHRLVLAGQGPDLREIEHKAQELDIDVVFAGHISDAKELGGLYAAASLFVFPSLYDNAPMVMREAAAMGTPSVATRGSSSAEPIADGVNGLLAADRSEDLCRVIAQALEDPKRLSEMGIRAQQTIPETWSGILDTVLTRYRYVIDSYEKGRKKKLLTF